MTRVHFTTMKRVVLFILLLHCSLFFFASRLESQDIIVSMGDSITTCFDGVDSYDECYVNRLSALTGLTPINGAVGGAHSNDGADAVDFFLQRYHPRYLTIYYGNNDAGNTNYPTDYVIANLRYMVERCQSYGTTPIIATLGAQFDDPYSDYDWAWRQPFIDSINSGIRQLAAGKGIPLADIAAALGQNRQYYSDSIHPNSAGHAIIADRFAAFMQKCTYTITPSSASHDATGGTGGVSVTTGSCSWTAMSNAPWITVTGGSSGNGSGIVSYRVDANLTGRDRTGTLSIAGQTFTVLQNTITVIQVTPASLNFGQVPPGSTKDLFLTVKNTGSETWTGNATTAAPFSIVSGGSYSLGPNQSQVVTIRFLPTSPGTHTGTVGFTGGGGATVPVTGKTTVAIPWLLLLLGDGP